MMKLALVFLAALALNVDGQTTDYSKVCVNHTMTIYPVVGPACGTPPAYYYVSGVSAAEITTIVDAHNAQRRRVATGSETLGLPGPQPQAANMRKMSWDTELAMVAQRWASQCLSGHDQCRNVTRFKNVGQNFYRSWNKTAGGSAPWTASINSWYREVINITNTNVSPFVYVSGTGHYSQLVWAESYLVGCGYASYKSTLAADIKNPYVHITACNYGPAGNVLGASSNMYKIGAPCSQCPAGTVCSSSLCV